MNDTPRAISESMFFVSAFPRENNSVEPSCPLNKGRRSSTKISKTLVLIFVGDRDGDLLVGNDEGRCVVGLVGLSEGLVVGDSVGCGTVGSFVGDCDGVLDVGRLDGRAVVGFRENLGVGIRVLGANVGFLDGSLVLEGRFEGAREGFKEGRFVVGLDGFADG